MPRDLGRGGSEPPVVVLGAGYAGLRTAQELHRRTRGRVPILLVDRHPVHVLRTELYEVGRIAGAGGASAPWAIPLDEFLRRTSIEFRPGTATEIDLEHQRVQLEAEPLAYSQLVIALGSVAAYYQVPGAAEHTHSVYRFTGAQRLAAELKAIARRSVDLPGERRPRVIVVGGGSTGTELAAEIAGTDWGALAGGIPARPMEVVLVAGALPFLAGLPPELIDRSRRLLTAAGVHLLYGTNVTRVEPGRLHLDDGSILAAEAIIWCAGLEVPPVVARLPVPHGRGGRLRVAPTLELPGRPGAFAVGDVMELQDPATGIPVPATAQAALAAARIAGLNLAARRLGQPLREFRYRERGVILALGPSEGAAAIRSLTLWGAPVRLLKRAVERKYAGAVAQGEESRVL
ncbi:MAG: FAD-dependent oxidoreductase [Thermoplasmata archaeon]|jgi:NADH dehydrogenase